MEGSSLCPPPGKQAGVGACCRGMEVIYCFWVSFGGALAPNTHAGWSGFLPIPSLSGLFLLCYTSWAMHIARALPDQPPPSSPQLTFANLEGSAWNSGKQLFWPAKMAAWVGEVFFTGWSYICNCILRLLSPAACFGNALPSLPSDFSYALPEKQDHLDRWTLARQQRSLHCKQ